MSKTSIGGLILIVVFIIYFWQFISFMVYVVVSFAGLDEEILSMASDINDPFLSSIADILASLYLFVKTILSNPMYLAVLVSFDLVLIGMLYNIRAGVM